jgi:hypothetical protein
VKAARGERERPPRRESHQPALGIQLLEHGQQIELVRAAAMEQNQRAPGRTGRGPEPMTEELEIAHPRSSAGRAEKTLGCPP